MTEITEAEWIKRYIKKIIELGYPKKLAKETAMTVYFNPEFSPEEAAEIEFDYACQDA